jgi:Type I phosphodiesterase / nucleotide pyrophosphatase
MGYRFINADAGKKREAQAIKHSKASSPVPFQIGRSTVRVQSLLLASVLTAITLGSARAQQPAGSVDRPHNVVIFVADGLRSRMVNHNTAPNMAALAQEGVYLVNSHSLFPTFTMANASAIATGHYLGDTGVFSNALYVAHPVPSAGNSPMPFIENDAILGDLDSHFGGDFLGEDTILKLARDKGYSTAAIGKLGPTLLFEHTERLADHRLR